MLFWVGAMSTADLEWVGTRQRVREKTAVLVSHKLSKLMPIRSDL